jgi:hypothetical protein
MSLWKVSGLFLTGVITLHPSFRSADADWNSDALRILSGNCVVSQSRIDETKLTINFFDFGVSLDGGEMYPVAESTLCSFNVEFRVPPFHKLKVLSQRILSRAEKDSNSELSLSVSLSLQNQEYHQLGRLLRGSAFNGRLLLYKSFDVRQVVECLPTEQKIQVRSDMELRVETEAPGSKVSVNVGGSQEGIDLWLDLERC